MSKLLSYSFSDSGPFPLISKVVCSPSITGLTHWYQEQTSHALLSGRVPPKPLFQSAEKQTGLSEAPAGYFHMAESPPRPVSFSWGGQCRGLGLQCHSKDPISLHSFSVLLGSHNNFSLKFPTSRGWNLLL